MGHQGRSRLLIIEHNPKYHDYGKEEPTHVTFQVLGSGYQDPAKDLKSLPREYLLQNIHHRSYLARTQAAKALRKVGALDELTKFLSDPDPRLRRAALDGLIELELLVRRRR